MGFANGIVKPASNTCEHVSFERHVLHDIDALDYMIDHDMLEKDIIRIGAEQEMCLIDEDYDPSDLSAEIIEAVNDPDHVTHELAKYNLEVNLDPVEIGGIPYCFDQCEQQLRELLRCVEYEAQKRNLRIILTGILPTIAPRHVNYEHMTHDQRYEELNRVMHHIKGGDFELNIQGVDEIIAKNPTILFEACNTSFQTHLQITTDNAVDRYNWAQAIAGPVLAISTNSPLLLGRELWSETRIALFQQSIDIRCGSNSGTGLIREQHPRVTFGTRWIRNSITEIFKEDIARFRFLVVTSDLQDSMNALQEGVIPILAALRLHNGTIYRWNRPCYGIRDGKPHLRIENRYIPSGPTIVDEIANFVFWVGLMIGMPDEYKCIWTKMDFHSAKANFRRAAISGIETKMQWMGQVVDTAELIRGDLLGIAKTGLLNAGVRLDVIHKYLGIIAQRLESRNGAQWMIHSYRILKQQGNSLNIALKKMTAIMHANQSNGKPVGEWDPVSDDANEVMSSIMKTVKTDKVYQVMCTDVLTVKEVDLVGLVRRIMCWCGLQYFPVENEKSECVGILSSYDLEQLGGSDLDDLLVGHVMNKNVIAIHPDKETREALLLMNKYDVTLLPVIQEGKLVGVITQKDLENAHTTWLD